MSTITTVVCDICKRELPLHPKMSMTVYENNQMTEKIDICDNCYEAFKIFRRHQAGTHIRNENAKLKKIDDVLDSVKTEVTDTEHYVGKDGIFVSVDNVLDIIDGHKKKKG